MHRRVFVFAAMIAGAIPLEAQTASPVGGSPAARPASAPAAAPDTLVLTLPDAITRAFRFGDEARAADAAVDVADAQVGVARSSALPQLRLASTSYTHTIQSARGQAVGSLFNQANTYSALANLSQTVFQGGRAMAGWRAGNRLADAAVLTRAETRQDIALEVTRAYLTVLLDAELVAIQDANLKLADDRLAQVQGFEKAGQAARYDVLRARVERANIEPLLIQARSDLRLAELDLKQLLNVPSDRPLRLTTALSAEGVAAVAGRVVVDTLSATAASRPAVRAAELTARAKHDGVAVARADLLPTVSVFAQAGYMAFPTINRLPTAAGRILSVDCPPGSTARTCTAQNGGWFDDRSVGVQISWALFDGLRTKSNIDVAQAQARLADVQLAQEREAVAMDVARARAEFQRASAAFRANRENANEAEEAFRLAQVRSTRGLGTQLDVSDAQIALMTARTNQARAANDLYLAAAGVERAYGRPLPLPDGGVIQSNDDGSH